MSSQCLKFETISYCVGLKGYSGTKNIAGEITNNKKTGREIKLFAICNGKKLMIGSDNTIQPEGLGDFFKNLVKKGPDISKKLAKTR